MKLRHIAAYTGLGLLLMAGLAYANRVTVMQYSLGWLTDLRYPREAYRPVPWASGPETVGGTAPATATAPPGQQEQKGQKRPPNIIVILADDLGFNDVTTHGGGYAALGVSTPHIDSIARDGVRFEQGYAGSAICTPSRAALLTGRYPWRFGLEFTPTPGAMARIGPKLLADPRLPHQPVFDEAVAAKAKNFNELGMPPTEQTVGKLLQARGYHTVHIGKWHLGSTPQMRPNNQGFDESLFMESGLYLPQNSPDVVNSKQDFDPLDRFFWPNFRYGVSYNGGKWFEPNKYLTDYFTDEAVQAIQKNKNRPFFMYLAHWGVHTPLQAAKADYDALAHIPNHRMRVYGAMIRSVDRSVGRILQTLKDQGLDDNTIVIFTSDNGAPGYIGIPDVNKPFRGWKLTLFEGGVRVPFVAKWPGHIPAGLQYQPPVSSIDILPAVVAAAGGTLPTDRVVDGVNVLPFLQDAKRVQADRPLFWRDGPYRAMQEGGWKLIVAERPKKNWLFHLKTDPTERTNLATQQPEKLVQMLAALKAHHAAMPPSLWASFLEMPVAIDKTLDQAQTADDEYTYWVN